MMYFAKNVTHFEIKWFLQSKQQLLASKPQKNRQCFSHIIKETAALCYTFVVLWLVFADSRICL